MKKKSSRPHCAVQEQGHECCDFCIHFLMYRNKNGAIINGDGRCGLHHKETDAGSTCKDYFCEPCWRKEIEEGKRTS